MGPIFNLIDQLLALPNKIKIKIVNTKYFNSIMICIRKLRSNIKQLINWIMNIFHLILEKILNHKLKFKKYSLKYYISNFYLFKVFKIKLKLYKFLNFNPKIFFLNFLLNKIFNSIQLLLQ